MAKFPWFPFYPSDFLRDERVQLMTNEQVGMYVKLLCHQWIEGSIPAQESRELAVLRLGWGDETEMEHFSAVIRTCFRKHRRKSDRLINPRLENIRLEQEAISKQKQEAGRLGGRAKARLAVLDSCQASATSRMLAKSSYSKSESKTDTEEEKKKSAHPRQLSNEEFLDSLKTNPAYSHIDLPCELGKMDAWLLLNPGRKKSRKFVLNWLNKIDKPLPISERPLLAGVPPKPPKNDPIGRGLWDRTYGHLKV